MIGRTPPLSVTAVLSVALALACPQLAQGRVRVIDSDPVALAMARAGEYWGSTPCGGVVGVVGANPDDAPESGENVPGERRSRAAMWASWKTPLGERLFTSAPSTFTDCVVYVNLRVWPDWLTDDENFRAFCKEMAHEYGHLEGYPDVGAVIGTVEYEQPEYARLPGCEHFTLTYGRRKFMRPSHPVGGPAGRG